MGPAVHDAAVEALAAVVSAKTEGQRRAGQDAMCSAVAESLVTGEHLLVEAPTGVGKSLAYLVPAVAHALSGGEDGRVVVVTATKALQEQLTNEDLPFLASALPGFSFAMLKGRSNYLCVAKLDVTQTEGVEGRLDFGPGGPTAALERVAELAEWAEKTSTGDRADAPGVVSDAVWSQVSVDTGECPGAEHCPVSGRCFAEAARERAAAAHIVVVNAHLYAAHLASGGYVLPPHDAVVFDEAHTLEDIFADAFGVRLTPGRIRRVASRLKGAGGSATAASALDSAANALERTLVAIVSESASGPDWGGGPTSTGRDARSLRRAGARPHQHSEVRVEPTEGQLAVDLAALSPLAADAMGALRRLSPADDRSKVKVAQALRMAEHLAGDVAILLDAEAYDNRVAWVSGTAERPELNLATVDVGPALAQTLYPGVTAVATSATLATGGRFDSVAARLGLTLSPPPSEEVPSPKPPVFRGLAVESPFDHRNQGYLYVARHLPEPNDPAFTAAMHDELHRLVTAAAGRTLALFTSRAAMERAADALAARGGYEILVQDRLPRPELLARFRSAPGGKAIFATQSFWQGVDLPGELCHLVAIDRIPFPRPNEPLHAARREAAERRGVNAFATVDLPAAATRLAQGTGRLIRTTADRGVVAVFDRRLATKSYRQTLLASMPPLRRTVDGGAVCDFLAGLDRDLL
jgi:ATP-dependent DNA helicase DinG